MYARPLDRPCLWTTVSLRISLSGISLRRPNVRLFREAKPWTSIGLWYSQSGGRPHRWSGSSGNFGSS